MSRYKYIRIHASEVVPFKHSILCDIKNNPEAIFWDHVVQNLESPDASRVGLLFLAGIRHINTLADTTVRVRVDTNFLVH